MSVKKTYQETRVSCYYYLESGVNIDHCKDCSFFNGYETSDDLITGVDCLRKDIGQINAHVTAFEDSDYLYTSHEYDEDKDGPLSEEYNYCEKCCFNKLLANGKEICTLRCGIKDEDEVTNFTCYEGEIWEKVKKNNQ